MCLNYMLPFYSIIQTFTISAVPVLLTYTHEQVTDVLARAEFVQQGSW